MNYKGVIIQESLEDGGILKQVNILSTKVEQTTEKHKTPWVDQWTLHTVEVQEDQADNIAGEISEALDSQHPWYADFKNNQYHFIIYQGKIFKVDLQSPELYKEAKQYGVSLGIPEHQIDFAPDDKIWER